MAYIQQKSERKFKIDVCNGYKANGQKRMKAQTISVPQEVTKRGIHQYVMAEAERLEKHFKTGIEEGRSTTFEVYAEKWLTRRKKYKESTLAGYARVLKTMYPFIGGIPLCKLRPWCWRKCARSCANGRTEADAQFSARTSTGCPDNHNHGRPR